MQTQQKQAILFVDRILLKFSDIISKTPFKFAFDYTRFYILSFNFGNKLAKRKLNCLRTRLAVANDLPRIKKIVDRGDEFQQRMTKGDICFIAESNDDIVGMEWLEIADRHVEGRIKYIFDLPPNSCWLYDGFIEKSSRFKGVWINIMGEIADFSRRKSIARAYCYISSINNISLNTHLRYGFQIIGVIIYVKILGINFHLIKCKNSTKTFDCKLRLSRGSKAKEFSVRF
ncbi:MAG: hypothetical protein ONB32_15280 [candidate division KSB1 bacterium]|nr:hypothetical protein [candidate division KSB1 bacterium]